MPRLIAEAFTGDSHRPLRDAVEHQRRSGSRPMKKPIVQEFVSLDGMVAGPKNSVDFVPASTAGGQSLGAEQMSLMDKAERDRAERKSVRRQVQRRAEGRLLEDARPRAWSSWNEVARLKARPGKAMLVSGSISVAQSLGGRCSMRRPS